MSDEAREDDRGRAAALARVRRALGRPVGGDSAGSGAAADRVTHPRANTIPLRGQLQQPQLGALFDEMVAASAATLAHVGSEAGIPEAVAEWCASREIDGAVVVPPGSPFADLDWNDAGLAVERRPVEDGDAVGIGTAAAGIAETGTLAVCSGPGSPTTANFLPDAQVLVLRGEDLVGTPEDFWMRRREQGPLPRTVNWITGPSRTGDIEMVMTMGAHGPVHLHVLIVDEPGTGGNS